MTTPTQTPTEGTEGGLQLLDLDFQREDLADVAVFLHGELCVLREQRAVDVLEGVPLGVAFVLEVGADLGEREGGGRTGVGRKGL